MSYRDELGQAHARIAQLEEQLHAERAKREPAPSAGVVRRRIVALVICAVVLGVGSALFAKHLRRHDEPLTFVPVDQVVAAERRYVGIKMRTQGELVPGTAAIRRDGSTCDMRFTIERNGLRMHVRLPGCMPPDGFRDDRPGLIIVAEGVLGDDGVFVADQILVRLADLPAPSR